MPRETGNHRRAQAEVFASNICAPVRRFTARFNGLNVGFFSLSAADGCCAYRDDYCSGPGRTFRRARGPGDERDPSARSRFPNCSTRRAKPHSVAAASADSQNDDDAASRRAGRRSRPAIWPRWSRSCAAPMPAATSSNASRPAFISNRRASRSPASSPSARSSPTAPERRPLPRHLLRRAVPARPILVRPRPLAADACRARNRQWQTAVAIAKIVDQDLKESSVGDALFFHARYVSPGWRLKRVASIGNHIFYR